MVIVCQGKEEQDEVYIKEPKEVSGGKKKKGPNTEQWKKGQVVRKEDDLSDFVFCEAPVVEEKKELVDHSREVQVGAGKKKKGKQKFVALDMHAMPKDDGRINHLYN